jgi:gamma-glutamyl-gamma-aminobutyrate hydrolase PuuD
MAIRKIREVRVGSNAALTTSNCHFRYGPNNGLRKSVLFGPVRATNSRPHAFVSLTAGGAFAKLLGCETIRVNSLHGQGILEPGERVVIEGVAEDGTIEAIRIADAPSFALGVQWHAEYDPQRNPINRALFQAFGAALAASQRR